MLEDELDSKAAVEPFAAEEQAWPVSFVQHWMFQLPCFPRSPPTPTVKVRRTLGSKAAGKYFASTTDEAMHCNGGRRASLVKEVGTKLDVLAARLSKIPPTGTVKTQSPYKSSWVSKAGGEPFAAMIDKGGQR